MIRKLLYLFVLAMFTGNIAYAQYIEDTLTINRTLDPPYIDGYNDWEWDTEEFYTIVEWGEDSLDNPHAPEPWDCTAKFKMLWDDEYIYFLGVIEDDFVSDMGTLADAGAPTWENDSWEFYIAPTLSKLESMEEMTQIRWSYATAEAEDGTEGAESWSSFGEWPGYGFGDFATGVRALSDDGWVLEVKLDLAMIAEKVDGGVLTDGSIMGWNITVSDNDGEAARDWIGNWIPDTQWDEADTLGILKLGSKLTGTIDTTEVIDPVGLKDTQIEAKFRIYPNPVANELRISGRASIEAIEVFSTVGTRVLRSNTTKNRLDVSDLQSGLYYVKVYTMDGLLETHKFLKE